MGGTVSDFIFLGSKITADGDCSHEIKRCLLLGRKVMTNLDNILKSRDITLPTKVHLVKAMVFPVVMYGCELDYKESWVLKNWSFWTVVLEKTLESPLDCKEIQAVHLKGDQSWVFIGRTDVEAETPILWPPHERVDSFEKTLMLGKIEGRRRRGWQRMRWMDGITDSMDTGLGGLGVGDGQGGLACCSSWGRRESDMTEQLDWTKHHHTSLHFHGCSGCLDHQDAMSRKCRPPSSFELHPDNIPNHFQGLLNNFCQILSVPTFFYHIFLLKFLCNHVAVW